MALSDGVEVRARADRQRGLFASRPISRGTPILTYDGPVLDHPTRYSIQIDDHRHIEGTLDSNECLNHSCAPNAFVDWTNRCLRALRDIAAGEEISCNYLTTDWELHAPFVCTCGAPNCYGLIKGFRYLSPDQRRPLLPFVPPFMRRRAGA